MKKRKFEFISFLSKIDKEILDVLKQVKLKSVMKTFENYDIKDMG